MENIYDPIKFEKWVQDFWEENKIYKQEDFSGEIFNVDTPPPTVSGSLHIGHIFSYTQTDIIVRYKRLSGLKILYPMGFDDNGLATERFVEKKTGISAFQIGRTAFRELCLKEVAEVEKAFEQLFKKMGLSVDWSKCYTTISKEIRAISQRSFIELYKKGLIYRKDEPALYCTTCKTSVAQAELEDSQIQTMFNEIIFLAQDKNEVQKSIQNNGPKNLENLNQENIQEDFKNKNLLQDNPNLEKLIVATTRPELLASCVALLYNPKDSRYQHLKGKFAQVPVFNFTVPILEDEQVVPDKGTGLVMCCTFGDRTDIEWFKKFNFQYKASIGLDGKMTEITGFLQGKRVPEARVLIIEKLKELGLLKSQKQITHAVNIHERCKQEIEYIAIPQWFMKILDYKKIFIEQGEKINWHPEFMKSRYKNWVENISWDWCLSRQKFYGIPFPLWHCKDCGEVVLADLEELPIDPQETKSNKICKCGSKNLVPETDVMDTWNTSSLTPYILSELYKIPPTKFLPMGMRPQAHDIIRTWTFYTIVKAWAHDDKLPWKDVVISGHVLTGGGQKISKSQANSPLIPENLLKLYPSDAIRYWTASAKLGHDVAFSENQLKIGKKLLVKIWNAFKFQESVLNGISLNSSGESENKSSKEIDNSPLNLSSNVIENKSSENKSFEDGNNSSGGSESKSFDCSPFYIEDGKVKLDIKISGAVNQWILHRATETFDKYKNYFDNYEFALALESLEQFFWRDFCDNYIEIIKDQFFNPSNYSSEDLESTKQVLYYIGFRLLQLFAPFIPHITENLYQELYKKDILLNSIHKTNFNDFQNDFIYPEAADLTQIILDVIAQVRKLKSENKISLKTEIDTVHLFFSEDLDARALQTQEKLLAGVTCAKNFSYQKVNKEIEKSYLEEKDGHFNAYIILS